MVLYPQQSFSALRKDQASLETTTRLISLDNAIVLVYAGATMSAAGSVLRGRP
jgi:hypothetical protein